MIGPGNERERIEIVISSKIVFIFDKKRSSRSSVGSHLFVMQKWGTPKAEKWQQHSNLIE
jgi:hypothetical protein